MIWVAKATYQGNEVEFTCVTDKDDLKDALAEAHKEANRVFGMTGIESPQDEPKVKVKKHPQVL